MDPSSAWLLAAKVDVFFLLAFSVLGFLRMRRRCPRSCHRVTSAGLLGGLLLPKEVRHWAAAALETLRQGTAITISSGSHRFIGVALLPFLGQRA